MKVLKFVTVVAALLSAAGAGLYYAGPSVRATVDQKIQLWIGWTEEARKADPVGFTNYVESRLESDLQQLKETRGRLIAETSSVERSVQEHEALLQHAEQMADEFRRAYVAAKEVDSFPITVRGSAYTEEQVLSQVSLLLAEAEGYRQSINGLQQVALKAEDRLQELTLQIDSNKVELAALGAQRELLRAEKLTDEGQRLVAHVDQLLADNQQVVHGNPVRSVPELLASRDDGAEQRPGIEAARRFLAARPQTEMPVAEFDKGQTDEAGSQRTADMVIRGHLTIDGMAAECEPSPSDDPAPKKKPRKPKRNATKPIFTQS